MVLTKKKPTGADLLIGTVSKGELWSRIVVSMKPC